MVLSHFRPVTHLTLCLREMSLNVTCTFASPQSSMHPVFKRFPVIILRAFTVYSSWQHVRYTVRALMSLYFHIPASFRFAYLCLLTSLTPFFKQSRRKIHFITKQQIAVFLTWRKTSCCKSYCSTVHFRRITSIYQPTNAHIISHKTLLKHFEIL